MRKMLAFTLWLALLSSSYAYEAPKAEIAPRIDGQANEAVWEKADWESIDQLTLGTQPSPEDFSGRFKIVWTAEKLYLLGEFTDDVLIDTNANPLVKYWQDDTFEFFIDEDRSGGNHIDNHNAFAYHIALDNQAIDYSMAGQPTLLTHHISSVWKRSLDTPNTVIWEVSFDIYPDSYTDIDNKAVPVTLKAGKEMGFLVAYCDSDGGDGRQHFMGSHDVPAVDGDKNRAYRDASVFDLLKLVEH